MKSICIYIGSNCGARPEYTAAAKHTAQVITQRGLTLVYGGSNVGLMKEIADTALSLKGKITGVITKDLVEHEVAHPDVKDMHIVSTMHERKALMAELSDGFIALPGSYGTFDEFFEMLAWAKLGLHNKPCGILNVCGFYDDLLKFLDHTVAEKFTQQPHRDILFSANTIEELLNQFSTYKPPKIDKWIRG